MTVLSDVIVNDYLTFHNTYFIVREKASLGMNVFMF